MWIVHSLWIVFFETSRRFDFSTRSLGHVTKASSWEVKTSWSFKKHDQKWVNNSHFNIMKIGSNNIFSKVNFTILLSFYIIVVCDPGVPSLQSVNDHYSTKLRFKQSPETKAIVDAKCQWVTIIRWSYCIQASLFIYYLNLPSCKCVVIIIKINAYDMVNIMQCRTKNWVGALF